MSTGGQFKRGLGFGAGFAVSWIVVVFVGIPLLFIGGCAVLLAGGSTSTGSHHSAPKLSARDQHVLEHRAMRDVRYHWSPPFIVRSSTCRFQRIDTVGPDSWNYACVTTATRNAERIRFREVIPCFTGPPYPDTVNCDTSGQTPSRVRSAS